MSDELPLVRLNEVTRFYQATELEAPALDNVSLEIYNSEFVAVMGPSGCGKSTLLNILGLIDRPSSGDYFFLDCQVSEFTKDELGRLRRGSVGFIFQSFNLIEELSVYENVELPLVYQNIPRNQRKNFVREVLELVGLGSHSNHNPDQLSGGQQQRVAVARAVVGDPQLILADEPTGNLDSKLGEEVMGMLSVLNEQGATIVMATHSERHAKRAHRIIEMIDGRILAIN